MQRSYCLRELCADRGQAVLNVVEALLDEQDDDETPSLNFVELGSHFIRNIWDGTL